MSHFQPHEFECKCKGLYCDGGVEHIDPLLIESLEELREVVGFPIVLNSAYRCPTWNKLVGGTRMSQHCLGKAADVRVTHAMREAGIGVGELASLAETIPAFASGGIGVYNTFVHLDVRGYPARWNRRK